MEAVKTAPTLICECGRDLSYQAMKFVAGVCGAAGSGKSKARTPKQARKASLTYWRSPEGIAKRKAARQAKIDKRKLRFEPMVKEYP